VKWVETSNRFDISPRRRGQRSFYNAIRPHSSLAYLTPGDEYTRECLAIDVAGSIRSKRVIEVLSQLASVHGAPRYLRSDNGPEFVSRDPEWAAENGMEMALSDPGKPWQNGADESFNGKFRDECLSLEWFRTRAEAKVVIEQWRRHEFKQQLWFNRSNRGRSPRLKWPEEIRQVNTACIAYPFTRTTQGRPYLFRWLNVAGQIQHVLRESYLTLEEIIRVCDAALTMRTARKMMELTVT
jgi:integrase-like protein